MMPKIDFFISPAYCVPPISTILRVKLTMTKTSELVPSRLGSARKPGALTMVNSGLCAFSSSAVGRMKSCRTKRLCQAYSLMNWMGSW